MHRGGPGNCHGRRADRRVAAGGSRSEAPGGRRGHRDARAAQRVRADSRPGRADDDRPTRRGLRLSRPERRRQDHRRQTAARPVAADVGRWAGTCGAPRRRRVAAPRRLPARALPLPGLDDGPRSARPALRACPPAPGGVGGGDPVGPRPGRPGRSSGGSNRDILEGDAAAPRPGCRAPGPARTCGPRRADLGPRPCWPSGRPRHHRCAPRPGHDGLPQFASPDRGRARLRPRGDRRSRPRRGRTQHGRAHARKRLEPPSHRPGRRRPGRGGPLRPHPRRRGVALRGRHRRCGRAGARRRHRGAGRRHPRRRPDPPLPGGALHVPAGGWRTRRRRYGCRCPRKRRCGRRAAEAGGRRCRRRGRLRTGDAPRKRP